MSYTELSSKVVKCRKPHRCSWCDEIIPAGEQAVSRTYVWQGDFQYDHMHPECTAAMPFGDDDYGEGFGADFARGLAIERHELNRAVDQLEADSAD